MISEWELWAVAARFVDDHGASAVLEAARLADKLSAAGDALGACTWMLVASRIELLQADDGTRH